MVSGAVTQPSLSSLLTAVSSSCTAQHPHELLLAALCTWQAANVICHGTRSQLKVAAEEVQRQIKVITCTRKKQACMEVLEVLCKVKRVQDLQHELR